MSVICASSPREIQGWIEEGGRRSGGGFTDTFMPGLLSGLGELGVASCTAPLQGSHGIGSKNIEMQVSPRETINVLGKQPSA